jgi:hypothetical protein
VTYRAELSGRALKQMHGLPSSAFDRLIEAMTEVIGGCRHDDGSGGCAALSCLDE